MKVSRLYTMDQDCIAILARQRNKSQYVCRAVRQMQILEDELNLDLVNTRYLLINLKHRDDISDSLKALIQHELTSIES